MAIFREDENPWNQLDWRLLQHGAVSRYVRTDVLAADCDWLAERGYTIDRLDCSTWKTAAELQRALATAFALPDHYGEDLDAFGDGLSTLAIADPGRVIVLSRFDVPAHALTGLATGVLDMIAVHARQHLLFGRRLLALVQTDVAELVFPPVGGTRVMWNPREWLARQVQR
ncbi:MAG: barstar family protein [Kofleriaceae bacterium]